MVEAAKPYLAGWIKTLGESGAAIVEIDDKGNEKVTPGNVTAAVAGLKILQDYLSSSARGRAESMIDKIRRMREKAVKEMKGG